ncbi:endonuclease domain-containing protein [Paramagnetospirillum kuznetsovii]|uniref:endonuclease domain-containing protein n=1 Tax=Paramagnetospirillum kuznetsovii TaxID=2053833 RepID=UPI001EFD1A6E|nr:DUF559 domain-containing protein [Paramagnetospirillum kuznetsovii]
MGADKVAKLDNRLKKNARALRSDPTETEKRLWRLLRRGSLDGYRFRRQHPVHPYILDFACLAAKLAVEADGGQHCESSRDHARTAFLERAGWRVLRFWNNEILENEAGVLRHILDMLRERCPHPSPPPAEPGEGE